jgi:hypothetical protein
LQAQEKKGKDHHDHDQEDCQQLQPRGSKLEALELQAIQLESCINSISLSLKERKSAKN